MTRHVYTLLWAQWRQPAWSLAALWAIVSIFAVAIAGSGGRLYYDLLEMYGAFGWIIWLLGLILIFEEQTTFGSRFGFPVRTFVLPVRPKLLAVTTLAGRVTLTMVHTLVCMGPILLDGETGGLLNAVAGAATVALYVQSAAFLHVRDSAARAIATTLTILGLCLLLGVLVTRFDRVDADHTFSIIAIAALPAIPFCYYAAGYARTGRRARRRGVHVRPGVRKGHQAQAWLAGLFRSPLWAQTWFEFGSTGVWFPVAFFAAALPMTALAVLTFSRPVDPWELSGIVNLGLGIATALGFLWERRSRAANRFSLSLPLSDATLGLARAMASLAAISVTLVGILAALAVPLTLYELLDMPLMRSSAVIPFLWSFIISVAPVWWIGFAAGRVVFLAALPGAVVATGISSLFWYEPSMRGEFAALFTLWILLALTVFILGFVAHRRVGTPLPWAWLAVGGVSILPAISFSYDESQILDRLNELNYWYLAPILMAAATLHFAHATGLLSRRLCIGFALLVVVAAPVLVLLLPLQALNAGLADSDFAAYLAAGLVLPFVWLPLVVRFQRRA